MDNTEFTTIYFAGEKKTLLTKEYVDYLYSNQIEVDKLVKCEYLGLFCRMHDVVRVTVCDKDTTHYVAHADETKPYYYELECTDDGYLWKKNPGSLEHIYRGFETQGVKLDTNIFKGKQKTYTK